MGKTLQFLWVAMEILTEVLDPLKGDALSYWA